jgi:hypothetical protein
VRRDKSRSDRLNTALDFYRDRNKRTPPLPDCIAQTNWWIISAAAFPSGSSPLSSFDHEAFHASSASRPAHDRKTVSSQMEYEAISATVERLVLLVIGATALLLALAMAWLIA